MRNPSSHQGENERVKKSGQRQARHFLHKTSSQEGYGSFTLWSCKITAKRCTKKVCCTCKVVFFAKQNYCCFFTVLVAFAAWHNMILYFVRENYKYYREQSLYALAKSIYQGHPCCPAHRHSHRLLPVLPCAIPGIVPPVPTLKTAPVDLPSPDAALVVPHHQIIVN